VLHGCPGHGSSVGARHKYIDKCLCCAAQPRLRRACMQRSRAACGYQLGTTQPATCGHLNALKSLPWPLIAGGGQGGGHFRRGEGRAGVRRSRGAARGRGGARCGRRGRRRTGARRRRGGRGAARGRGGARRGRRRCRCAGARRRRGGRGAARGHRGARRGHGG